VSDSANAASTLISQAYVKLDGENAPYEFMHDLVDITVESSIHLPAVATMLIHDASLRWIDFPALAPGKPLVISTKGTRQGQAEQIVFDGEIVELEPGFRPGMQDLTVRAFDRLHRLTYGRQVRSFLNVTDGDLVQKIAAEVHLQAEGGPTAQVHPYVLQNNETNLEFLRRRVGAQGYILYVQGQKLNCRELRPAGTTVELEWGRGMNEFRPRLTTLQQASGVTVRGWDPAAKREIVGQAQNGNGAPQLGFGKTGAQVIQEAFRLQAPALITDRPVRDQGAADRLAQAEADRIAGTFVEAEGTCAGNPALIAGASVKLSAVGERFGGTYLVTSATHTYSAQAGYSTLFTISGHRPSTLVGLLAPEEERAPIRGLVVGVVTDNLDPEGLGRVKVKFPSLSASHASDWARVVVPGGGAERGLELLPEINDEVLVGFELGDVHYPYVLGGLWNGKDPAPKKSQEVVEGGKVQRRLFRSRSGHLILFDDSDGGGGITIEDRQGNKVFINSQDNSLTVTMNGDTSVSTKGKMTFEATGKVEIKGMGVSVDGGVGKVDVKGMGVSVDGGAATVDVKATMVNLN
jgi:phage protein D/phage baseplate assembly protein gpV